jgi:uncharacterized membrane protein YgdD (TMEM256/DUF423 family)
MIKGTGWGSAILLIAAGLVGAAGVIAAAGASHAGESRNLGAIATVCLAHGPALLALGLVGKSSVLVASGLVLAIGTVLFAADLCLREWLGHALLPGAAPLAGGAMILGWLGVALGGVLALRKT